LKAHGKTPQESAPLLFVAGSHDYEFSVKIDKDSTATAGIVLFYNSDFYVGTGFDNKERLGWRKGAIKARALQRGKKQLWLKIRNSNNIMTAYYSGDGKSWKKEGWARDISGYHHNTLYDFISILPGLFAYGEGEVRFSAFQFTQMHESKD
jgi:beta-xylosidase